MEKQSTPGQRRFELTEVGRGMEWRDAINKWFESGSMERIVARLRENVPMRDAEARFFAAIVAGEVKHWRASGGPSEGTRFYTSFRNAFLVRPRYQEVLLDQQRRKQQYPELRLDPRREACEIVSKEFAGEVGPDAVKKIVEKRNPRYFVTPDKVKEALQALWNEFEKKPDEVL